MSPIKQFLLAELASYGDAEALFVQPWRAPGFPLDSLDILQLLQDLEDAFVLLPAPESLLSTISSFAGLVAYLEAHHEQ